jgi:uncharacterized protein YjbI with pentapeptide repeats
MVALGGLAFTAAKALQDSRKLRQADLDQREKDRQQREKDRVERQETSERRLEESFNTCVTNLGSDSEPLQASAAVGLLTFLKPGHESYREQVFLLLLAELKVVHAKLEAAPSNSSELMHLESLNRLLVRVFERAARMYLPELSESDDRSFILDLTRTNLDRVNLSELDLTGADIAFASLKRANLSGSQTILRRVKGREAHLEQARFSRADLTEARLQSAFCSKSQFHETRLVSADLQNANLKSAEFQQAKMQGARLGGADLRGAQFQQAVLDDAYFFGATFDEVAAKTLASNTSWRKAHFDDKVREHLGELSQRTAPRP